VHTENWIRRVLKLSAWQSGSTTAWQVRDTLAALALFTLTAAVVLWQNAHVAVLWDLSYVLDTATRIAQGQMPYHDFPLVHPPLTFLIHAALIRLTGRVYFHHALYCAVAGGLGSLLAWRMVLRTLRYRMVYAWALALTLSAPLTVLGLYCIFPFPSYDCDTLLATLLALWLLTRLTPDARWYTAALTGAALVLPLIGKQNIGLPLLVVGLGASAALLAMHRYWPGSVSVPSRQLLALLAGSAATLGLLVALLAATCGLGNYFHWTILFAEQRRMPGLALMAQVYTCPLLWWALPCSLAGLLFLRGPLAARAWAQTFWARLAALALLAAPWLTTLASIALYDDADERGDALLALWPLVLILAVVLVGARLVRAVRKRSPAGPSFIALLAALAAIHGTLMSQQLWGSTYALWPLFLYLLAELATECHTNFAANSRWFTPILIGIATSTLLICGALYTVSEGRLSYAWLDGGAPATSEQATLSGLSTPGNTLADLDELLAFAHAAIPQNDTVLLLPGEDPFYFATGRSARFPVLLFDLATDPLSPQQTLDQVHQLHIHWLIVKRELQIKENPMPNCDATLKLLEHEFFPVAHLRAYDIYHFAGVHPH